MRRILLSPSWWLRHVLLVVLVGLFLRLGWWQWEKGSANGTLQNLFYGIEWPFFAGCVIFGWWRMVKDELSPPPPRETVPPASADLVAEGGPTAGSPAVGGPTDGATAPAGIRAAATSATPLTVPDFDDPDFDDDEEDEELAEYNRYLAALDAHDRARSDR